MANAFVAAVVGAGAGALVGALMRPKKPAPQQSQAAPGFKPSTAETPPPPAGRETPPTGAPPQKLAEVSADPKFNDWTYVDVFYCVEWTWTAPVPPANFTPTWIITSESYGTPYTGSACAYPPDDPPPFHAYHVWLLMMDPQYGGTEWKEDPWDYNY